MSTKVTSAEGSLQVRALEKAILSDPLKQVNLVLTIRDTLKDTTLPTDVRLAALHSLRRIFIEFIESGRMTQQHSTSSSSGSSKVREYKQWLQQHLLSYEEILCGLVADREEKFIAPALRTMLQFVAREYLLRPISEIPVVSIKANSKKSSSQAQPQTQSQHFGFRTYSSLILALLDAPTEIDIDSLLMLREEIFSKPDCVYYALRIIRNRLRESRSSSTILGTQSRNALDLLRVISVPESISEDSFLVQDVGADDDDEDNDDDKEDGDSDDSDANSDLEGGEKPKKKIGVAKKVTETNKRKRPSQMSKAEQLRDRPSYQKVFSKAWLAFLSLPLSSSQHKLVLKHLPENVIGEMESPLLLADYLSQTYSQGGVLAVLALESLFQLIVKYNLDYPDFFTSLYRLCTTTIFAAKYRGKLMTLLCASLKSTNLPAYLVAAFVKRLLSLALHSPTPSAIYCLAQATWLLRQHPQCLVLLHRVGKSSTTAEFNILEESDLGKSNALQSSLWEAELLLGHHMHSVSALATSLQSASSTAAPTLKDKTAPLRVEDYLGDSYVSLMEAELARVKKNAATAFKQPEALVGGAGDYVGLCFA